MSNKTISINPSLFSISSSKTKKNREKKSKPNSVPLISPNVLKNKLLKRIKEHKQKETQNLENNNKNLKDPLDIPVNKSNNEILKFTDEFTDSINYLQTLSKQRHIDNEKKNNELLKQKRREELERKTIRNYHNINQPISQSISQPIINIDLPEELMQTIVPTVSEPFKINVKDDIPYGVLKGGLKPSYREWSRTQRNNIVTNPNASLIIQGGNINSEKTVRENRLNLLKQKIKNKNEESIIDPMLSENLIKKSNDNVIIQEKSQPISQQPISQQPISQQHISQQSISQQPITGGKLIATKHITKKTIKRKYTLGRSKIKKTVSVLIKDRGTRKKILNAQKDLKRRNINDIKTYLREHNLIKTGSNAPNDVLRKLYESAMLAGEITNSNSDTLLHNFSKENKEL
jgi:hypothetical protein